jgi:subtilase family serine protease
MRKSRIALVISSVLLIAAAAFPASANPGRVRLTASRSSIANPSAYVRPARASDRIEIQVYLGLRDAAGAKAFVSSVSDPSSPTYAHYLTPAQFRARFSRPQADADAVASWLRSQGFAVGQIPANHVYVPATATVAQAERAFGVKLNEYEVGKQVLRAPATAPSVPSSLVGLVRGVLGLDEDIMEPAVAQAPPPAGFRVGHPCSNYWAEKMATKKPPAYGETQPWAPCGYTPQQLQGAYGIADAIAAGNDGSGVTVGIVDAYLPPTLQEDLDTYASLHGLPQTTMEIHSVPPVHGPLGVQQGWYGESTLDVEAVHSMAPGASILFWGTGSGNGVDMRVGLTDIIDNARADIVSNSYGSWKGEQGPNVDTTVQADTDLFTQAGAEGIGVYFSSGDSGDEVTHLGYRSVDLPASNPFVTAVGGTSLAVGASNDYLFETGWGTGNSYLSHGAWKPRPPGDFFYGGGGGTSKLFDEPSYQDSVVPDALSGYWGSSNRVVPDISVVGDPNTGFLVGETQTFPEGVMYDEYRIGGTSLSSPLFAGIMALADQRAGFHHGFANPALYTLDGTTALRDIVDPAATVAVVRANFLNGVDSSAGKYWALRTMNFTGTLHTITGYDDVTGIGTPNGEAFLDALS